MAKSERHRPEKANGVLNGPNDSTTVRCNSIESVAVATMKCPKCQTETLGEYFVEDVAVDRCSSCDGIWFDAQELSQLLVEDAHQIASLRRGSADEQADGKKGRCPRDESELLRVFSAIDKSVVLDACAECRGIWLDGGEFAKLFAARRR